LPAEALDGVEQEGGDDALAGLGDSAAEGSQRECLMLPSVLSVCQKPGGMNAATTIEAMIAGAEAPLSRAP
jgi:hypothetical protein